MHRFLTTFTTAALLALALPAVAATDVKTDEKPVEAKPAAVDAKPAPKAEDYVLMKVNNEDVTAAEFKHNWENQFPPGDAPSVDDMKPEIRERILRGLMTQHLLLAEADKAGVEKTPAVQQQLADTRKMVLIKAFLMQKGADSVSDSDVKAAYDEMVAATKDEKEVRASHILVPTEKEAKEAKKKLADGKNFAELAKEMSKDPGSAAQGGDLGYFTKDRMVKEFADAAFAMKKGEISDPVKSPFGWHIIKVEDVRKVTPPPFADVKDQLRIKVQERKMADYIRNLIKKSDVKVYDEKGKEVKFERLAADDADKKK